MKILMVKLKKTGITLIIPGLSFLRKPFKTKMFQKRMAKKAIK